jgi:putative tricarboxylic transport membrane protein
MVVAGLLGFFMKRFGFSPAAAIVALVLGPIAEETLRQSLLISNGSPLIFYQRPVAFGLAILIAVLVAVPVAYRLVRGRSLPTVRAEED